MIISIIAIIVLVALDQLTKYLAVTYLQPVGTAEFIPGVLRFTYVENRGAAFSSFAGQQWLLIGVTSAAIIALCVWLFYKTPAKKLEKICAVLIIAGGVGNLIDRVIQQYVVDFFDVEFIQFAVFNVADCFVVVGVILLAISLIASEFADKKAKQPEKEAADKELQPETAEQPAVQPKQNDDE